MSSSQHLPQVRGRPLDDWNTLQHTGVSYKMNEHHVPLRQSVEEIRHRVWTQGMNNPITPSEQERSVDVKSVLDGHRGGRFNK